MLQTYILLKLLVIASPHEENYCCQLLLHFSLLQLVNGYIIEQDV